MLCFHSVKLIFYIPISVTAFPWSESQTYVSLFSTVVWPALLLYKEMYTMKIPLNTTWSRMWDGCYTIPYYTLKNLDEFSGIYGNYEKKNWCKFCVPLTWTASQFLIIMYCGRTLVFHILLIYQCKMHCLRGENINWMVWGNWRVVKWKEAGWHSASLQALLRSQGIKTKTAKWLHFLAL
jgi:hypothetical protein